MTNPDLKVRLDWCSLSRDGNKAQMVSRLTEAIVDFLDKQKSMRATIIHYGKLAGTPPH
jgi:phenylpyruvate tautomerase PptA (4-oxalocrotonate tautomerase family)